MLLKEIKTIFHRELATIYPKMEVDSFFYLFMEHYLNMERFALALQPDYVISKEEEAPFFEGLSRLKKEEPVQYILGEAHFMDLKLKVNPNVLIPRPETEELVGWVVEDCRGERSRDLRILDIGTGSGCIAIALRKAFPEARVYGLDISKEALSIARENAENNNTCVEFLEGDILNLDFEFDASTTHSTAFDLIVSNPPYVREMEKAEMGKNVKEHEPSLALFVPDTSPLKYYKAIAEFSKKHLKPNGSLYFEINQYLAKETQQLLVDNAFKEVELRKDIFGNFRMLKGKMSL